MPGTSADRLVQCLRAHAQSYSIGVEHYSDDSHPVEIMVVDQGGHASDMLAFLRGRLDVCGRELGFEWRDHLKVQQAT